VEGIARLARSIADDERELETLTDQTWCRAAQLAPTEVAFDWDSWFAQSASLQRRLLVRATRELEVPCPWSFRTLEAARSLLAGRPVGRRLSPAAGLRLSTSRQGFRLSAPGRNRETVQPAEPEGEVRGR
jgi:hypothetical protein